MSHFLSFIYFMLAVILIEIYSYFLFYMKYFSLISKTIERRNTILILMMDIFAYSSIQTILLQDRQGVNYCVACSELDSDNTKDDPGTLSTYINRYILFNSFSHIEAFVDI